MKTAVSDHNEATSLLVPTAGCHHTHNGAAVNDGVRANANSKEMRSLLISCGLTSFFFFVELIGGYYAGSLAVMSDAAHLLSDLAGLLISVLAVSFARIPPSELMSFGYARAEVLGAFVSLIFIWTLTLFLVVAALQRLFDPQPVNGALMLLLGAIGLAVNLILGFVLGHGHSHAHHHDHDHHDHTHSHEHANHSDRGESHTDIDIESPAADATPDTRGWTFSRLIRKLTGDDIESINVRAAFLHVLGDALQSVGVIIAGAMIMFRPHWSVLDPMCTIFFACIVLFTTRGLAAQTMCVLMEGTPTGVSLRLIHERLLGIEGVLKVGDLHAWSITLKRPALSVHLYKDARCVSDHDILKQAQAILEHEFRIDHTTVQINCVEKECCDIEAVGASKDCLSITSP